MAFYDLSEKDRQKLVEKIQSEIENDLKEGKDKNILRYFSDEDTYIRRTAYLAIGKVYLFDVNLLSKILKTLDKLFQNQNQMSGKQ